MKKNNVILLIIFVFIVSCNSEKKKDSPVSLFNNKFDTLRKVQNNFSDDDISRVYGLRNNDSSLIILDYHSGKSYSLFNLSSQNFIARFGTIGEGPGEIPSWSSGDINGNYYYIFYNSTGIIVKYDIDSLYSAIRYIPETLTKYKIPDAFFSKLIPINDSLYLGAGTYKEKYQYVLFNSKSEVIDYNVEIYNSKENWHRFNKELANQGNLRKHPLENKFVFTLNNSSNLDIIEVSDNKINPIKLLRFRDPKNTPDNFGENVFSVTPDMKSSIGYIDIAAGNEYIYVLYTDKIMVEDDGKANSYCSDEILVFDWAGNPVKKYHLGKEAYHIAVSEKNKMIYLSTHLDDGGWTIDTYSMEF